VTGVYFLAPWTSRWEPTTRGAVKIFLAGGTGFLGRYLSRALARKARREALEGDIFKAVSAGNSVMIKAVDKKLAEAKMFLCAAASKQVGPGRVW
jgi:hypothetical protein